LRPRPHFGAGASSRRVERRRPPCYHAGAPWSRDPTAPRPGPSEHGCRGTTGEGRMGWLADPWVRWALASAVTVGAIGYLLWREMRG
jgi:hypothetical protein